MKKFNKLRIQTTSLVALDIAIYSTSVEDQETKSYFFAFYEIGEEPSWTNNMQLSGVSWDNLPNLSHDKLATER